jgi:hypothetical protein
MPIALPPASRISATALSMSAWPRATTATLQPSAASMMAVARPMPLLAPATNATLPEIPRSMSYTYVQKR